MRKAIYPGSFDPITLGHVDIIERLNRLYDEVLVVISNSPRKAYTFNAKERAELVKTELKHIKNVRVHLHDGLTVDFAKEHKAQVIIRGLRAVSDFEYEMSMANINSHLNDDIETLIVFSRPEFAMVSSRATKEIAHHQGSLKGLVSDKVAKALIKKIKG